MKFHLDHTYRTRYALLLIALFSLKSFSQTNESSIEDPIALQAPENWYQAEVILFTQQGNIRGESPPKNYQLEFPENWMQLTDPEQITEENQVNLNTMIAEQDGYSPLQPYPLSNENNRDFEPYDYLIPEASIPYRDGTVVDGLDNSQNLGEEPYIPEYEQPFLLLNAPVRDLNQSATMQTVARTRGARACATQKVGGAGGESERERESVSMSVSLCLRVCLSVCICVCLSVCVSACLSLWVSMLT